MADQDTADYYRQREIASRANAARSSDPLVINLHNRLADEYAKVANGETTIAALTAGRRASYGRRKSS